MALDLDGTTLDSRSHITARTERAIFALIDAEVPVVIATSRPERVLPVLVGDEITKRTSHVQLSGTVAKGRPPLSGNFARPLADGEAAAIWQAALAAGVDILMTLELDGIRFAVNHEADANELWALNAITPDMIVSVEEALEIGPSKVSINGLQQNLDDVADAIRSVISPGTTIVGAAGGTFLNIMHRNATKEGALDALLSPVGIGLDDVLAFGDDHPDEGLLTHCGWSVAVENAIPSIKALARFETASNDDHGVAIVLERLSEALGR